MSEYINHEEAYSYVSANYLTSNIARCYLDLREQRNDLLEALVEIMDRSEDVLQEFLCEFEIIAARKAIAKAKGEV